MSLAKSLGGEESSPETDAPHDQSDASAAEASTASTSIGDLLSGLSGGIDPSMIQMMGNVMHDYNAPQDDRNLALITALRPFLKEKRLAKVDQAVQLAKFSRIARVAFQMMKGGEESV